jgi:hypothetical protein
MEKEILQKYIEAGELISEERSNKRQQDIFWDMLTDDEKKTALAMMVRTFGNWCWDVTDIANKVINNKTPRS